MKATPLRGGREHLRCRHGFWRLGHQLHIRDKRNGSVETFKDVPDIDTSNKMGIQVTLKAAKGLQIDANHGAPYVKFDVPKGGNYTTKPNEKSDSPDFNESFFLVCEDLQKGKLIIDVLQKHTAKLLSHNIGSAVIDLGTEKLQHNLGKPKTIILKEHGSERKKKSSSVGELYLEIKPCLQHDAVGSMPKKPLAKKKSGCGKMVTVAVVNAKNLNPTDKNGLSDPYVKLKIDAQSRKTKCIPKTLEPQFKESFDMLVNDISTGLLVEVYDRDFGSDDFMGGKLIDLSDYPLDQPIARDHTLLGKDRDGNFTRSVPCGAIFLQITVSDLMQEPKHLSKKELQKFPGVLRITIKKAKGLSSADRNGYSDPFCVVENGKLRFRTRTIYKQLSPEWNRTFVIPVTDVFSCVTVGVYDEDDGGKSIEHLGCITLRLLQIKDEFDHARVDSESSGDKWYALKTSDGTKRAGGDILIETQFSYKYPYCYKSLLTRLDVSYIEKTEPFKKHILTRNIGRITKNIKNVIWGVIFLNDVLSYKKSNSVTLIGQFIWTMACLYGELYHVPLVLAGLLLVLRIWQKLTGSITKSKSDLPDQTTTDSDYDSEEDEEEEDKKENKKKDDGGKKKKDGLLKKIEKARQLAEDISGKINNIASLMEKAKNVVFWHRIQISGFITAILVAATIVVYFFGSFLRYVFLLAGYARILLPAIKQFRGIKKKKKKNPPVLNMLKRVPDDMQLMQYQRLKPRERDPRRRERDKLKAQLKQLENK